MGKSLADELRRLGVRDPERDPFKGIPLNRLGRPLLYGRWMARGRVPKACSEKCCRCGTQSSRAGLVEDVSVSRMLRRAGFEVTAVTCFLCAEEMEKDNEVFCD